MVRIGAINGAAAEPDVTAADPSNASCDTWSCTFDDLAPGDAVASVTFQLLDLQCRSADATVEVEIRHRDRPAGSASLAICEDMPVASSSLSLSSYPDGRRIRFEINNAGPDAAPRVDFFIEEPDAQSGAITIVDGTGPSVACGATSCAFEGVPVGDAVASVTVELAADGCERFDGTLDVVLRSASSTTGDSGDAYPWCDELASQE